jgi:hypothetical protein
MLLFLYMLASMIRRIHDFDPVAESFYLHHFLPYKQTFFAHNHDVVESTMLRAQVCGFAPFSA